jgi:hypothetical protein
MFTFACSSIEGLTLAQKRETITALKASVKFEVALNRDYKRIQKEMREQDRETRAQARAQKQLAAADKRVLAELKLQDKIAKAQLRLQKLQDKKAKPVGSKAIKANRKASKVTVLQIEAQEANAIAAKFAAKKQVA